MADGWRNEDLTGSEGSGGGCEYEFDTDKFVSEILCDNCRYKGLCSGDPPCEFYKYVEEMFP